MRKNSGFVLLHNIVIFLLCALLLAETAGTAGRNLRIHLDSLNLQKALNLCEISVLRPDSAASDGLYTAVHKTVNLNSNIKAREVSAVDETDGSIICSILFFEKQE